MIRKRNPLKDDGKIYRLVAEELLPYTRKVFPAMDVTLNEVKQRLTDGVTYVAVKRGQRPLGFIHLLTNDQRLVIDMLAVDRTEQGKGWGKKLMVKSEQVGVKWGCRESVLMVDDQNKKAKYFYQRLGYHFTEHLHHIRCEKYAKLLERSF